MVINGDCLDVLPQLPEATCIFADPPDNIGLNYHRYDDNITNYGAWLDTCINLFVGKAKVVWVSYNSKHVFAVGDIITRLLKEKKWLTAKSCVQTFTFGQHNKYDFGNNHRMLLRLKHVYTPLYLDSIRIPSWRQLHGDKRANPNGRVPGDVFDFPRVTGNSKQRRSWHPTQLHEDLVRRCIKSCTKEGDTVIDPFAGTGTVERVCKKINRQCTSIEIDPFYCEQIENENKNL